MALVDDCGRPATNERIRFVSLHGRLPARKGPQQAELELEIDGESAAPRARPATARSMPPSTRSSSSFPHEAQLQLYQVHAVTEGTDAQAEVTVRLEENGKTVNGQGADTDTLVASAAAPIVHALNKLLVKREKTAPAALSA